MEGSHVSILQSCAGGIRLPAARIAVFFSVHSIMKIRQAIKTEMEVMPKIVLLQDASSRPIRRPFDIH